MMSVPVMYRLNGEDRNKITSATCTNVSHIRLFKVKIEPESSLHKAVHNVPEGL
jgi:hypothetical protein